MSGSEQFRPLRFYFRRQCSCWLTLLLVSFSLGLQSQPIEENFPATGAQWLVSMSKAAHELNYQGTVVYLRDKRVETMNVFHAVYNGVEQERMVSLNDPMREVIRDPDKVTCYFPDTRTIVVDYKPNTRSFLFNLPEYSNSQNQSYRVNLGGREHVAQRLTQVIDISPVDNYRYARKIWIDVESKIPLRHEVFDESKDIIEQMIFTSFVIKDFIPLKFLSAATKIEEFSWKIRNKESIPAHKHPWMFNSIPEGFRQVLYIRRKMPTSREPIEHILLSDGFASVSVYVDQAESEVVRPRQKALGAVNSYSLQSNNHQITVMGEVPAVTVKMIADGIYFKAGSK